VGFMTGVKS